jgi:hypothetical protein
MEQSITNYMHFITLEHLLQCLKEPATGRNPEPGELSPHTYMPIPFIFKIHFN